MPDYRAYFVGADGHFQSSKIVTADSDDNAIETAKKLVDSQDVELWHLDRKIVVLPHKERSGN